MANLEMDGGIQTYLRDIAKTPLLTREEEVELADRIKKGDKEARAHMIKANLRLVVKIAQDYANYGLPLLDLISEGNMGLMKAVERFDPNKGGKLSTYAAWWIKQAIKRGLANQSKTIRLPVHMVDKISKMRRVAMVMSEELGREPTDEELAEELGIDRAKIAHLKSAAVRPASLDAPVSDDDTTEFGELIGDERALSALQILINKNNHMQLDDLLEVLDERERKIIDMRFGLAGQKPMTLEEVGEEFSVTRERIRQLQNIATKKMRRELEKREKDQPEAYSGDNSFGDEDEEGVFQPRTIVAPSKKRQTTSPKRQGPVKVRQPLGGRNRDISDTQRVSSVIPQKKQEYGPPLHNFHLLTPLEQKVMKLYYGWDTEKSEFCVRFSSYIRDIKDELGITDEAIDTIIEGAEKKLHQPKISDTSGTERENHVRTLEVKRKNMPSLEERESLERMQKQVIDLWFGFDGTCFVLESGLTFREIGERLRITADEARTCYEEAIVFLERNRAHLSLPRTVGEYEHAVDDAGYAEVPERKSDTRRPSLLPNEGNTTTRERSTPWWQRDDWKKIDPPKHQSAIQVGSPKTPGASPVGNRSKNGDRVASILSGATLPAPPNLSPEIPEPEKEQSEIPLHMREQEAVKVRAIFSSLRSTALQVAQMYWGENPESKTHSLTAISTALGKSTQTIHYHISNIRKKIAEEDSSMGDSLNESPELFTEDDAPTRAKSSEIDKTRPSHTQTKTFPDAQDTLIVSFYTTGGLEKLADDLGISPEHLESRIVALQLESFYAHIYELERGAGEWLSNRDFAQKYGLDIGWLDSGKKASQLLHNEANSKGLNGPDYYESHVRDYKFYSPHTQALLLRAYKSKYPSRDCSPR